MKKSRPYIILGNGGHAKVLINILLENGLDILGTVGPQPPQGAFFKEAPYLGDDRVLSKYSNDAIYLVNGIGAVNTPDLRKKIFCEHVIKGFQFPAIIARSAHVGRNTKIEDGVQILPGVIVGPFTYIGKNTVLNTACSVDHDCKIGSHVHISPGATLAGGIEVKDDAFIGIGSVIIQNKIIGAHSLVAAGAVVVKSVGDNQKVFGVPAKESNFDKKR